MHDEETRGTPTLTIAAIATRLSCSEGFVRGEIHAGRLRAYDVAGGWRVRETDFAAWLGSRRVQSRAVEPDAVLPVQVMLAGLRSVDPDVRFRSGVVLSFSLGQGLKLSDASELDCEHGVGRDLSNLIGRAMAGDSAAVDELETRITNDPARAQQTPRSGLKPIAPEKTRAFDDN